MPSHQAGCTSLSGVPAGEGVHDPNGPPGTGMVGPDKGKQRTPDPVESRLTAIPVYDPAPSGGKEREC